MGETDFPCLSDERVGGGRTYIQLDAAPSGDQGYADWIAGIQSRRSYFGDGRSHIFNFTVSNSGHNPNPKEVEMATPGRVQVTASVCARITPDVDAETERIHKASPYDEPYWHLERARIGSSRKVSVELIVNGFPVQQQRIEADGSLHDLSFDLDVSQSSWIALRILPSSHTNPHFVLVRKMPVRASKRSAQWCRTGVDVCWEQKLKRIRPAEMEEAASAFEHARATYARILSECTTD